MLRELGLEGEDLFADIPAQFLGREFRIAPGMTEQRVRREMSRLAARNATYLTSFLGGGFYDHFVPAALKSLVSRSEFYTAYTPYQPEISQGTLQAVYEYQSAICRLTDMEIANASLYDGGTAIYEAIMMAMRITGRNRILMDENVNPIYREMIRSYTTNLGIELVQIDGRDGKADAEAISAGLNDETAAVVLQNPNFLGCIEDFSDIAKTAHGHGALMIVSCYPVSLALLKTPGAMGADIVTGEGQSLGLGLSFGGPHGANS
jgi:glycine dehydrogenase subunit 1